MEKKFYTTPVFGFMDIEAEEMLLTQSAVEAGGYAPVSGEHGDARTGWANRDAVEIAQAGSSYDISAYELN